MKQPLSLLLLAILWLLVPGIAGAQSDAFQAETAATYTFGQTMHFSLHAKSGPAIEEAVLFFNTPEMENTYVVEMAIDPERELMLEHDVDLTQLQLAPFTTVTYWWRLGTEASTFTLPQQTIEYVDDRLDWEQLSGNGISVFWAEGDVSLGQTALDVVGEVRPRLEAVIPGADVAEARIFIYPSEAYLQSALRLTGRDWVGAHAQPELGVILAKAVNPRTAAFDLGREVPHELVHLMLYDATGVNYANVPRWFEEGLATSFEMSPDPSYDLILQEAIAAQETIPFTQLCEVFPAEEMRARLAYAQSYSLIRFIQTEYGNRALSEMVRLFGDGADCYSGVRRALGMTLGELEDVWLERKQPLSPLANFWQHNGLWVVLLGGGFALTALLLLPLRNRDE
jgi:hypothetical protein